MRGTIKTSHGAINKIAILIISTPKKGITPLNVSIIGTSVAIFEIINTFKPTGGVIRPNSITISDIR